MCEQVQDKLLETVEKQMLLINKQRTLIEAQDELIDRLKNTMAIQEDCIKKQGEAISILERLYGSLKQ